MNLIAPRLVTIICGCQTDHDVVVVVEILEMMVDVTTRSSSLYLGTRGCCTVWNVAFFWILNNTVGFYSGGLVVGCSQPSKKRKKDNLPQQEERREEER